MGNPSSTTTAIESSSTSSSSFSSTPRVGGIMVSVDDVMMEMFTYLQAANLARLAMTCRRLRDLVTEFVKREVESSFEGLLPFLPSRVFTNEIHFFYYLSTVYIAPSIRCGFKHTSLVTKGGHVFTWGDNPNGELGLGHRDPRRVPTRVPEISNAKSVSCGYTHTLVALSDGRVLCFGAGSVYPREVRFGDDELRVEIKRVAAGNQMSAFITTEGELFVAGPGILSSSNTASNTNVGTDPALPRSDDEEENENERVSSTSLWRARKVELPNSSEKVAFVAAGEHHLVLLTSRGEVYTVGENTFGQLGLGHYEYVSTPTKVTAIAHTSRVIQVSAGSSHSAVLTADGELFTFGCTRSGKLGLPSLGGLRSVPLPRAVPLPSGNHHRGIYVGCGHEFTLLLTSGKEIVAFGDSSFGQLGNGSSFFTSPYPNGAFLISLKEDHFVQIGCGGEHSAVLSKNGKLYMAGNSNLLGVDEAFIEPQRTSRPRMVSIDDGEDGMLIARHAAVF